MTESMKTKNADSLAKKYFLPMLLLAFLSFFVACQDENSIQSEPDTDQAALKEIAEEDSVISSFELSFDESGDLDFLGKTNTAIYPFKVTHHMFLTSKNLTIDFQGDTAYGVLTKTFDGTLNIKASFDSSATLPDTVIKKTFSTTVTRNIVFVKVNNTQFPKRNWKIAAVSLPEGGTQTANIDITKLTAFLPNGDTLVINSPNEYYLIRQWGHWWRWNHIPVVLLNQDVTLQVELTSAYADTDYVTITHGTNRNGNHRIKKRFELISSTQNGNVYNKVFEQTFNPQQGIGFHHAIINAMPFQVVNDDATPVEIESWGVPYFIRN